MRNRSLYRCHYLIAMGIALFVSSCDFGKKTAKFELDYQAILLDTGQVYYGKFVESDSTFLVFRDVFYILSQVDPQTKETKSTFVRRGKEAHAPVQMYLNIQHVVMVEPVKTGSRIAEMIKEFESRKQ